MTSPWVSFPVLVSLAALDCCAYALKCRRLHLAVAGAIVLVAITMETWMRSMLVPLICSPGDSSGQVHQRGKPVPSPWS